jgi:hypothetical protein
VTSGNATPCGRDEQIDRAVEVGVAERVWVPLRADRMDYERRQGPEIIIFGRLAPGVTVDGAQAELTTIGLRTSAAFPKTHERLRPRIVPYTALLFDDRQDRIRWLYHPWHPDRPTLRGSACGCARVIRRHSPCGSVRLVWPWTPPCSSGAPSL